MHSYSVKLVINSQRIKANGLCSLYLQVLINRTKILIRLNLSWPVTSIDEFGGKILPRNKRDQEYSDNQMIILSEMAKANEIFKIYRIQDKILSKELFFKEYRGFSRRVSFIDFMTLQISHREKTKLIEANTAKNHRSTLKRLTQFNSKLLFHEVDKHFLEQFAMYLRTDHENEESTIWGRIKDIKAYLEIAEEEGIRINSDYKKYENISPKGRVIYLEDSELDALVNLYNGKNLDPTLNITLKAFLFSCFTSLRISDVQLANWGWVNIRNEMTFVPYKGRKRNRQVTIMLNKIAISLIDRKTGLFFNLPTDQEINRSLKDLAEKAKINKELTFHVARHTFGSHFYRETNDIVSLQHIMGHSKIETTMVYVHINEKDKRDGIEKMEQAFLKHLPLNRLVG